MKATEPDWAVSVCDEAITLVHQESSARIRFHRVRGNGDMLSAPCIDHAACGPLTDDLLSAAFDLAHETAQKEWASAHSAPVRTVASFDEAVAAASRNDLALALTFFKPDEDSKQNLLLSFEDEVSHEDCGGMLETFMRRIYTLHHNGAVVASWWEEYSGYYGCGFTGWWVEKLDADGPPEGILSLLQSAGINIPEVVVPCPPDAVEENCVDED